jgi:hypothetical protein
MFLHAHPLIICTSLAGQISPDSSHVLFPLRQAVLAIYTNYMYL